MPHQIITLFLVYNLNQFAMKKSFFKWVKLIALIPVIFLSASTFAATYYSKGSLAANSLSNWSLTRDGSGASPANFTSGDHFVIQDGHAMTTGAAWTVSGPASRIEIEDGGTLTATYIVSVLNFQVNDGGTYIHNVSSGTANGTANDLPGTGTGSTRSFAAGSTVEFQKWANGGTAPVSLPILADGWGNLKINVATLSGNWVQNHVFTQATTATGMSSGSTAVTLSAANSRIAVGEPVSGTGIAPNTVVAAISGTSLTLSKGATQTISSAVTLSFGALFTVKGDMTISQTGGGTNTFKITSAGYVNAAVNGSFYMDGGRFTISQNTGTNYDNMYALTISGNLVQTGGDFTMSQANNNSAYTLNIGGNTTINGGIFCGSGFTGIASISNINMNMTGNLTINSGGTFKWVTGSSVKASSIKLGGSFTVNTGGTFNNPPNWASNTGGAVIYFTGGADSVTLQVPSGVAGSNIGWSIGGNKTLTLNSDLGVSKYMTVGGTLNLNGYTVTGTVNNLVNDTISFTGNIAANNEMQITGISSSAGLVEGMEVTSTTAGLLRPHTVITQISGSTLGISPAASNGSVAHTGAVFNIVTTSGSVPPQLDASVIFNGKTGAAYKRAVYTTAENPEIEFSIIPEDTVWASPVCTAQIFDFQNNLVASPAVTGTLSGDTLKVKMTPGITAIGWYYVKLSVTDGPAYWRLTRVQDISPADAAHGIAPSQYSMFAIVPVTDTAAIDDAPIALDIAVSSQSAADKVKQIELAGLSGAKWVRDRISWGDVEPSNGSFNFTSYKNTATSLGALGMKVLQVFSVTPAWAKSTTALTFPDDLRNAYDFGKQMAIALAPDVTAFEIWNEEDIAGYSMEPPDQYAGVLKAMSLGFRDMAGRPHILMGPVARDPNVGNFGQTLFANSVSPYLDSYSFHTYAPTTTGTFDTVLNTNITLNNYAGLTYNKPWLTETSLSFITSRSPSTQSGRDAQMRQMMQSLPKAFDAGIGRVFWYLLRPYHASTVQFGMIDDNDEPFPSFAAFAAMTHTLQNKKYIEKLSYGSYEGYVFGDDTLKTALVLSTDSVTTLTTTLPGGVQFFNVMGNPITASYAGGSYTVPNAAWPFYIKGVSATITPDTPGTPPAPSKVFIRAKYPVEVIDYREDASYTNYDGFASNWAPRGYFFKPSQDITVTVEVYNFDSVTVSGSVDAVLPSGFVAGSIPNTYSIAPGDTALFTYTVTADTVTTGVFQWRFDLKDGGGTVIDKSVSQWKPHNQKNYYSKGSLAANSVSNWSITRDGSGASPANFTSGDHFVIQDGHAMTTGAAWTVSGPASRIEIEDGGTLTATYIVSVLNFQVNDGGTYIHNVSSGTANGTANDLPGTGTGSTRSFAAGSTVEFQKWANGGTAPVSLPILADGWGNLKINVATLSGNWVQNHVFTQATTATGMSSGSTAVTLSAANSRIAVGEPVSGTGIAPNTVVAAISGTSLTLSKGATQTISSAVTLSFGALFTVKGDMTISQTGGGTNTFKITSAGYVNAAVNGSFYMDGGRFTISQNTGTNYDNMYALTISGNLVQTGGDFTMSQANNNSAYTLNIGGNTTINGGIFCGSGFTGIASISNINMNMTGNLTINSGGTFKWVTGSSVKASSIKLGGSFTVNTGGTFNNPPNWASNTGGAVIYFTGGADSVTLQVPSGVAGSNIGWSIGGNKTLTLNSDLGVSKYMTVGGTLNLNGYTVTGTVNNLVNDTISFTGNIAANNEMQITGISSSAGLVEGMEVTSTTAGLLRPHTVITQISGSTLGISPAASNGSVAHTGAVFNIAPLNISPDSLLFRGMMISNNSGKLFWQIPARIKAKSLVLEKSADGVNYSPVNRVIVSSSYYKNRHFYIDYSIQKRTANYYRLKLSAGGNQWVYSKTVKLDAGGEDEGITVSAYPNPAVNIINIAHPKTSTAGSISIFSLYGKKLVALSTGANTEKTPVDVSSLSSGIYLIVYDDGLKKHQIKFIKN